MKKSEIARNKTYSVRRPPARRYNLPRSIATLLAVVGVCAAIWLGLRAIGIRVPSERGSEPLTTLSAAAGSPSTTRDSVPTSTTVLPTSTAAPTTKAPATTPPTTEPTLAGPPVIEGVRDLEVEVGGTLAYRTGVSAKDAAGKPLSLIIDNAAVDLAKPGVYVVFYRAEDSAGQKTELKANVTVKAKEPAQPLSYEQLIPQLDETLTRIGVHKVDSQLEKARLIHWFVKTHIIYDGSAPNTDWPEAAAHSLRTRYGDCLNYYALSRALLTRAGIPNQKVTRIDGTSDHYWNLVNVGTGWYHFDTCVQRGDYRFVTFMRTDAEVAAFSDKHFAFFKHSYYKFDSSLHPPRATTPIPNANTPPPGYALPTLAPAVPRGGA